MTVEKWCSAYSTVGTWSCRLSKTCSMPVAVIWGPLRKARTAAQDSTKSVERAREYHHGGNQCMQAVSCQILSSEARRSLVNSRALRQAVVRRAQVGGGAQTLLALLTPWVFTNIARLQLLPKCQTDAGTAPTLCYVTPPWKGDNAAHSAAHLALDFHYRSASPLRGGGNRALPKLTPTRPHVS